MTAAPPTGTTMHTRTWVALGLLACAALGCGGSGEVRYRLSGKAEFDGHPIAYGDVLFTPDAAKGNAGPQGIADIRDGQFDTAAAGGKGIAGGPTVIRVTGFTGEGGKLICEYEWSVDLPRADGTRRPLIVSSRVPPWLRLAVTRASR